MERATAGTRTIYSRPSDQVTQSRPAYILPMKHPRLHLVALDCPEPYELATFYSALTGIPVETWPGYAPEDMPGIDLIHIHQPSLSFQRVENYTPPTWPTGDSPKQLHLDFVVDDLDESEAFFLSIGAKKTDFQPGETFRVFLDPVGHPFCLILDPDAPEDTSNQ